jgi:hypothetical protein
MKSIVDSLKSSEDGVRVEAEKKLIQKLSERSFEPFRYSYAGLYLICEVANFFLTLILLGLMTWIFDNTFTLLGSFALTVAPPENRTDKLAQVIFFYFERMLS